MSTVCLLLITLIFVLSNRQNSTGSLVKLREFNPTELSLAQKQFVLQNEKMIKRDLLDIYLADKRYLGSSSQVESIPLLYQKAFDLDFKYTQWMQRVFNWVVAPYIFKDTGKGLNEDSKMAQSLFERYFDVSIQSEFKLEIRKALSSTMFFLSGGSGLLEEDAQEVFLEHQDVKFEEHGQVANLEVHEVYRNTKPIQKEVLYHFYVPEGTVIKAVWLSETDQKKYAFQISPRGAAQETFKRIVERGEDPALLELVGPRTYRLKVYPIPPFYKTDVSVNKMHLWVEFAFLRQNDSYWEFPKLTNKRNVFWNEETKRTYNGELVQSKEWLPSRMNVGSFSKEKINPVLIDGFKVSIDSKSVVSNPQANLTVILDSSFSMKKNREEVKKSIEILLNSGVKDFLYFGDNLKELKITDLDDPTFYFGSKNVIDLVGYLQTSPKRFEKVLILTDSKGFVSEISQEISSIAYPIWILIQDSVYPNQMSDKLFDYMVETGSNIHTSIQRMVDMVSEWDAKAKDKQIIAFDEAHVFRKQIVSPKQLEENDTLKSLVASQVINYKISSVSKLSNQVLDDVHRLAKEYFIVSPYSSAIVLVNEAQKKLLAELEMKDDRFNREIESGEKKVIGKALMDKVTAVPEPHEWLLIFIAVVFCLFIFGREGRVKFFK